MKQIPGIKKEAFDLIDKNEDAIVTINDSIFAFAEIAMQEFETCKLVSDVLKEQGFTIETGISGFPTAVLATYGSGSPIIALHTEYDALPGGSQQAGVTERKPVVEGGPGHAEGHNCGAAVMLGALFAIKEVMERHKLGGTLKFFGVPAEELVLPRPFFVRDGYFNDADVVVNCHIAHDLSTTYGVRNYGNINAEFEFFGKSAHASTSPWTGVSAVDAAKLMDIGWDVLREHLPLSQRSHSVFMDAGVVPNMVPDYARIWFMFRNSTSDGVRMLFEKAKNVAEGAAKMTGCTWKAKITAAPSPGTDNQRMAEVMQKNIDLVGMPKWTDEDVELAKRIQKAAGVPEVGLLPDVTPLKKAVQDTSSNDGGDITWVVPHARLHFPSNVPGVPFHHWCAGISPATPIGHKGALVGAKVVAGTVCDLLTEPGLIDEIKKSFAAEMEGIEFESLLPDDAKAPVGLNKAVMDSFRPELEKHYVKKPVKFVK